MLAKLAQLSVDEWWCTPAWLAHGFLAMAKPTIIAIIQAITLLMFPWGLCLFLPWTMIFSQQLELQAPSQCWIHLKRRQQCQLPRKPSNKAEKKKRLRDKFGARKKKLPIKTYLFLWFTFLVGCYVEIFLCQTYPKAWRAFLCCLIVTQDVREKATRIFRAKAREIISNELTVDGDLPTYLDRFNSDSFCIGIDTLCTQTLSDNKSHFQDLWLYNGKSVTGIAGGLEIAGEGKVIIEIEDDDGWIDTIKIPCSFYVPSLKLPLLSPQYLAETAKDNHPIKYGTNQGRWGWVYFVVATTNKTKTSQPRPTYQHTNLSNCSRFHPISSFQNGIHGMWCISSLPPHSGRSKPTSRRCQSRPSWFCSWGRQQLTCWWKQGKWGSELQWSNSQDKQHVKHETAGKLRSNKQHVNWIGPLTFLLTPSLDKEDLQEISTSVDDDQAVLMQWHFQLGHLPLNQLKELAKNGEIPKKLVKTMLPWCAGCLFGAMTKVPWQTKGSNTGQQVFKATKAGQAISVDQMISTQPGFIVQHKSKLTNQCYKAATIFVNHFSGLQYIHMMTNVSSNKTLKANWHLSTLQPTAMLPSNTTMQTMDALQTTPSLLIAISCSNDSPTVASTPTSKRTLLREQFVISQRPGGNSCCMIWQDGQMQSIWLCIDPSTSKSRSGWIAFYAGFPIIWASKLQSQVTLLTMEAKYISMSMALWDVIPLMELIN